MNYTIGFSDTAVKDLVKAFSESTIKDLNDMTMEYGLHTGNFKSFGSWDLRFNRISNAARKHGLDVLTRKRGGLWTFNAVLNPDTGALIVFTKEKNLNLVIKEFGSESIHYFHALLSKNRENQQTELFREYADEFDAKRTIEAQKILEEDYSSVNQVFFIVGQEESKKMTSAAIKLYDSYFNLLDIIDLTNNIPEDNYDDIFVSNEQNTNEEEEAPLIPVIKESTKKRKSKQENIPDRKEKKDNHKQK